jgi:hypothetical protein
VGDPQKKQKKSLMKIVAPNASTQTFDPIRDNASLMSRIARCHIFQTENPNFGKFWRDLRWKMLLIFWPNGIFSGHCVYFLPFWYVLPQNLATLLISIQVYALFFAFPGKFFLCQFSSLEEESLSLSLSLAVVGVFIRRMYVRVCVTALGFIERSKSSFLFYFVSTVQQQQQQQLPSSSFVVARTRPTQQTKDANLGVRLF